MIYKNKLLLKLPVILSILSIGLFVSCQNSPHGEGEELLERTANYAFNEGQLLDDVDTAYGGEHDRDLTTDVMIEEMDDGNAAVTLKNTMEDENYPVHAHDTADPETTPNGTPYNETPNGNVFAKAITGNGGSASAVNETQEISYSDLIN